MVHSAISLHGPWLVSTNQRASRAVGGARSQDFWVLFWGNHWAETQQTCFMQGTPSCEAGTEADLLAMSCSLTTPPSALTSSWVSRSQFQGAQALAAPGDAHHGWDLMAETAWFQLPSKTPLAPRSAEGAKSSDNELITAES